MTCPKIGITLGDPGGIGPEVALKALSSLKSLPEANYILFGSRDIIEETKHTLKLNIEIPSHMRSGDRAVPVTLLEIPALENPIKTGVPSKTNGEISFRFFKEAVNQAAAGTIQAVVTSPISKRSWTLAGLKWAGHTEYLSHLYPEAIMAFWSHTIKVALFTHHIPLKKALESIRKELLLDYFLLVHKKVEKICPQTFHFLVAGLNPHAGEGGILGKEEEEEIIPAIQNARKEGVPISGPYPPDVVFRQSLHHENRIVIALYHDQGLIPFKLEAFDTGVNVTLGLPFIRTSPDHGTGFDIAGLGEANPRSMVEAIKLAHFLLTGGRTGRDSIDTSRPLSS